MTHDLSKLHPCPKCGGTHIELYILMPQKGRTAVLLECKECEFSIQSRSVETLYALKKQKDFIAIMEHNIIAQWAKYCAVQDTKKGL